MITPDYSERGPSRALVATRGWSDNLCHLVACRLTPLSANDYGLSDGWTSLAKAIGTQHCICPDTPRYKQLGNAVTVPVAEWIGRRIMAQIGGFLNVGDR